MKDTVKSMVDNYGTSKVHYTVVIYGIQALATAEFSDKALTKEDVKEYIDSLPKPRGKWFAGGRIHLSDLKTNLTSYIDYREFKHDVYGERQMANSRQLCVTKAWKFTFFNLSYSYEKLLDKSS